MHPAAPPYVPSPPTAKSSAYDVYGQPRLESGRLPEVHVREEAETYFNDSYLDVEEPTMRTGKTSSLNLIRAKGQGMRQFQLSPKHLHFGTVALGQVVHKIARLTNISAEIARFSLVRNCSTGQIPLWLLPQVAFCVLTLSCLPVTPRPNPPPPPAHPPPPPTRVVRAAKAGCPIPRHAQAGAPCSWQALLHHSGVPGRPDWRSRVRNHGVYGDTVALHAAWR